MTDPASLLRSFLASLGRRSRLERDMDAELRFHREARASDLERAGLPRAEAERRARLEFGSVEGYKERFTLVCSASELSGLAIVELFCARFRQEDAFRDLKQRLGWEECRAWTRNPIERTTQAILATLCALRLLQMQDAETPDDLFAAISAAARIAA